MRFAEIAELVVAEVAERFAEIAALGNFAEEFADLAKIADIAAANQFVDHLAWLVPDCSHLVLGIAAVALEVVLVDTVELVALVAENFELASQVVVPIAEGIDEKLTMMEAFGYASGLQVP